jgi:hypothetical protein
MLAVIGTVGLTLLLGNVLLGADDSASRQVSTDMSVADWRQAEYAKIARLSGGLSLSHFEDVLGVPLFTTHSGDRRFTQYLFRGRDYWVQALADDQETVVFMAVTSCAADFNPRFGGVRGASPAFDNVVLNQTPLDQTGANMPSGLRYFTSGATANSYYFDEYYFGNPGYYKTYFVGINDACPAEILRSELTLPFTSGEYANLNVQFAQSRLDDAVVRDFRAAAIANTYGETGVAGAAGEAIAAFQIGPDRILTRTAPPYGGD